MACIRDINAVQADSYVVRRLILRRADVAKNAVLKSPDASDAGREANKTPASAANCCYGSRPTAVHCTPTAAALYCSEAAAAAAAA